MTSGRDSNPAVVAYIEQVVAYLQDPTAAPHDDPPKPPTPEIGMDVAAECAKLMALFMDVHRTGKLPEDVSADPSPESRLAVAELMDRYMRTRGL